MAEINRRDIWPDDLINAPNQYKKSLEEVIATQEKLINAMKAAESSIQSATTISKVTKETKELANAQGELEKSQRKADEATKAAQQSYKEQSASLEKLTQRLNSLKATIESSRKNQKEDLELAKKGIISRQELTKRMAEQEAIIKRNSLATQQLNAQIKNQILSNTSLGGSYQKLTIQLNKATLDYKNLAASGNASTEALRKQLAVVDQLKNKVNTIDSAVGQFQRNVGNYPKTFLAAGSALRQFVGAFGLTSGIFLFAQALKSAIQTSLEFEKRMSAVKAISGATGKDFESLKKSAVEIGGAFKEGALGVAGMQLELSRLGFTTKEILDSQKAILLLAQATGSDLSDSADLAGSTLRAFEKDAKETAQVAEVMAAGFNTTALSIDNYRESIKYVAPIANAANISLEETTALLGVLANANIRGSQAGTSLRRIINDLAKDGRPLVERLKELAAQGITLADAQDEVGRYAQTALIVLANQTEKVEDLTVAYKSSHGVLEETSKIMTDNVAGSLTKAGNAWDALILRISKGKGYFKRLADDTAIIFDLIGNENAKAIAEQRGFWARLFPNIDQLLNLEEYKKRLDEMKQANEAYEKITTEGFVKPFETWEEWQQRQINKLVSADKKKILSAEELAKLEREEEKRANAKIAATVRYNEAIIRTKELELSIQEEIYNNQDNTLSERLAALNNAEKIRTEIITAQGNKRIAQARKDSATLKEIEQERLIALQKLEIDNGKERREIIQNEKESELNLIEQNAERILQKQLDLARIGTEQLKRAEIEKFVAGKITREKLNRELERIDRESVEFNIENEITQLQSVLLPALKYIRDEKLKLHEGNLEEQNRITLEYADKEAEIMRALAQLQFDLDQERINNTKARYDEQIVQLQKLYSYVDEYGGAFMGLFDAIAARRVEALDSELQAQKDFYDQQMILAGDNENAKDQLRLREIEEEKRVRKEIAKEQARLARVNKAFALTQLGIQTAIDIAKIKSATAAANAAALVYGPLAPAIIAGNTAAMAAQIGLALVSKGLAAASIIAAPIPQYATGTGPGGTTSPIVIAGEKGHELYRTPSGQVGLTPASATLMKMPLGTEIIPNDETMRMLALSGIRQDVSKDYHMMEQIRSLENTVSRGNKDLIKAVIESAPGDLFMQGSLMYEGKKKADGSKQLIRRKTFGY